MSQIIHSLDKFDSKKSTIKPFNAIMIGKRNTGKSILISDMLYFLSKQEIPRACVFSATEESTGFFSTYIPDSFIFDETNVEAQLTSIIEDQKKLCMRKRLGEIPKDTDLRIVIVLDDMGSNKKLLNSKIVKYIFMNGRHYKITLLVAIQHIMQLGVDLRSNSDFVLCLKEGNKNVVKNLYDNFFGVFDKFAHFRNAFSTLTTDYGCLVLDNTNSGTEVSDVVKWHKAVPGRKFRLGSKEFWKLHESRYITVQERYIMANAVNPNEDNIESKDGKFIIKKNKKKSRHK